MKASQEGLIKKKILNDLVDDELKQFNHLLETDEAFARDYNMAQSLAGYVANEKLFDFRNKLQNISAKFRKKEMKQRSLPIRRMYTIASIAASIIILFGSYLYLQRQQKIDDLFQSFYNVDEVYLNTRSGNSTSTDLLEQGLLLFEKDKYLESINYFDQLPTSVTALYYSGVAHMELEEYEVAVFKFDQVIVSYLNVFHDQAQWYKGLCLMKQEKVNDAKDVFTRISHSESYYKGKAKELTKKLN